MNRLFALSGLLLVGYGAYDQGGGFEVIVTSALYVVLAYLVGLFANQRRNRDGIAWFALALWLTPLVFIVLAILQPAPKLAANGNAEGQIG